jgi:hypothetical protein
MTSAENPLAYKVQRRAFIIFFRNHTLETTETYNFRKPAIQQGPARFQEGIQQGENGTRNRVA